MTWEIETATTEDQWTEEYARTILASRPSHTPPHKISLGATTASWFPTEPGVAFISTRGGSPDDRIIAEAYLREWLRNSGWRQAQFTFYLNDLRKQAAWPDIEQKAKRLIQSGNVQLLRNGPQNIVGYVVGDHGEYQTEISREDPNSQTITQWQCDCPWDQYAWQRTRQWKKYEGRPCAHVLATYWASQSAPLDEEVSPGQPQQTLFDPGTAQPTPGGVTNTPAQPLPQPAQLSIPGISVPAPEAPKPPDILPPAPLGAPAPPGVVSVPGARPPTPADPTQYPGGTFSKVAANINLEWYGDNEREYNRFEEADYSFFWDPVSQTMHIGTPDLHHSWLEEKMVERGVNADLLPRAALWNEKLDIAGYGNDPNDPSWEPVRAFWRGVFPGIEEHSPDDPFTASWHFGADFENSDMVQLNEGEYGIMEGKSEEHGAGQYKLIPKGSIGEVLGQDPNTGWVDVAFAQPQANAGPMEPYHVRAWIEPSNLTPRPDILKPGPFIRRR